MGYALPPGLSVCLSDGRPVFLDLNRDRYFCLTGPEEECFRRLLDGVDPAAEDAKQMDRLISRGILREEALAAAPRPCRVERPVASLFDAVEARFNRRHALWLLAGFAQAGLDLKYRALTRVIGGLSAQKAQVAARSSRHASGELRAITEAFRWSGLVVSTHDRCLPRSIALSRYLARRHIAHAFVFGVTLRPFRAHCWIEHDHVVLTDRLDTVLNFTPILLV